MKVLYLLSQEESGLPHYTAELANAVAEHEEVILLKPTSTTADDVFSSDIEVVNAFDPVSLSLVNISNLDFSVIRTLRGMLSYRAVKRIREFDPDIVHIPCNLFPQVQFFLKLYGIDQQYPLVVTYHEVFPDKWLPNRPFPGIVHNGLNRLLPSLNEDRAIVHTNASESVLHDRGYSEDQTEVIPHGTYSMFTDYDHSGVKEEENTILFFGTLVSYKDLELLVNAATKVADEIPDLTLIIAGNGEISEGAQRVIQARPELFEVHNEFISNEVVGEYFSRAQAVVLPYEAREGQMGHSGVLTIAFAYGKPIIASDVGEFEELVAEQGAGIVVPPNDESELATAISRLLLEDRIRESMSNRSKEAGQARTWKTVAEQHLSVYKDIIQRRRQGSL